MTRKGRKLDTYQVCVTIIEARHLELNANPMVVVRVGNRKKKTGVRKTTDNPYYNEYFVFELTCTMESLLSTRIELAVYLCGRLGRTKFHGSCDFELATVWDQADHQYYHKWAMLTNPRDPAAGTRGYIKCNIVVHAKGYRMRVPPDTDGEDDIEGNLLLPLADSKYFATRQRARYVFTIHRAEDTPPDGKYCVSVSFAGMKASTTCVEDERVDERLVFSDMFPPLCHRVRITLKRRKSSVTKSAEVAAYLLNFKNISNSGEYGFLPTFGPSFLHLYADLADSNGPIYRGRLLLSLKTEIERIEDASGTGVHVEPAASIIEPPHPIVSPINDTIDGTKEPNKCIQYDYEVGEVLGVEDCLYLNIYVPSHKANSSLPVIVWLHEGAYQRGAGTHTKAKYLMDRDVILVTLNYRLGLFGFLSTGDNVVSGNMGLKDQNLALRWLMDNIEFFGGDPRKISLFGASAGGSSVHYHYLSKSSHGLFRNGMSISGTSLSGWAYDPEPLKITNLLASTFKCDTKSSIEMVECLRSFTADDLAAATKFMQASLWRTDEFLLVGVLFDACMIDRGILASGKTASIGLSLGNAGSDVTTETETGMGHATLDSRSETPASIIVGLDQRYNCMPLGTKKPCVFVKSRWPNTEWRVRNSNRLCCIASYLETELERIESLLSLENEKAYLAYNVTMRNVKRCCTGYLNSLPSFATICKGNSEEDVTSCLTTLDRHRLSHCKREIERVLERLKINGELTDNRFIRIAMAHACKHYKTIKLLCEDPQHSLPDVFLYLQTTTRHLAFARLPSSSIIYALERSERGVNCGRRLDIFLHRRGDESDRQPACKLEIFLWLGESRFADECWNSLPPGFVINDKTTMFPELLDYEKMSKYQLQAHIFQGRFEPGMDSSGLLDPLLRVFFQGYTMATRVIKQTLDPFWDQTLVFPAVEICGEREYVKKQPPKVVIEAFDRDYCNSLELYGRCIATPSVKLLNDDHKPTSQLSWYRFPNGGAVLAALELVELDAKTEKESESDDGKLTIRIPENIRPRTANYRLEVIFWGVRDMRRVGLVAVHRPKIIVECAGTRLESPIMENAKRFANFKEIWSSVDFEMAENEAYYPPLTIKAYDSRGFGYFSYIGVCSLPTIRLFVQKLLTRAEYEAAIYHVGAARKSRPPPAVTRQHEVAINLDDDDDDDETLALTSYKKLGSKPTTTAGGFSAGRLLKRLLGWRRRRRRTKYLEDDVAALDRDESHDWWSKYYASLEEEKNRERGLLPNSRRLATFKIYNGELEAQPEFDGFQDRLRTFELKRGKKVIGEDDDDHACAGKFKGFIAVYRWPHPDGFSCVNMAGRNANHGLLTDYPTTATLKLLLRLYVVKAVNLRPSDPLSGKADPYLRVSLGKSRIDDRKRYLPNQLNPTFGRVFELQATFPRDHTLTIQVWDYDTSTSDDLIGETRIDVESRFYSRHRGHCGLATHYDLAGYNAWRDRERPCQILRQLCRRHGLPLPEYWKDHVAIGKVKFYCARDDLDDTDVEERMALSVLHRWSEMSHCGCVLVPEHIERRPLFNLKRPQLEQGRLEMWIDMFPVDEVPLKPAIDISPQPPEDYEIRVIVWNTEDVPLVDSQFLTGEKCSDVYVKGWILPEDVQRTDVHYNSLTGEGNFNWRFLYRVTWEKGERMMIVRRKGSVFARQETEMKMPCKLTLQVWDSDHFSKDDFLGALSLDLASMPRGSHSSSNCTLRLIDPQSPRISLFRVQRTRAWWPLASIDADGKHRPAGKIELELSLLTASEADKQPVGKGREPPEALPPPDRPDTSYSWFRNPWKALRFVVCRYYRWRILGCCMCTLLVLLVGCAIYAFPGYLVKRFLGA